jgi:hypothetical protein
MPTKNKWRKGEVTFPALYLQKLLCDSTSLIIWDNQTNRPITTGFVSNWPFRTIHLHVLHSGRFNNAVRVEE